MRKIYNWCWAIFGWLFIALSLMKYCLKFSAPITTFIILMGFNNFFWLDNNKNITAKL